MEENEIIPEKQPLDESPNLVGSQCHGTPKENDIWSHPMNKGVSQKNIQHFNTVKSYLDSVPKDDKGNCVIDGNEFIRLMNSFSGAAIQTSM
jgi:hypothetical protein